MRPTVAGRVTATVLTASALAGCSSVGALVDEDEQQGPPSAKIAVLVPQDGTGPAAEVLAAVELAVDDRMPVAPGWAVTVVAIDASDAAAAAGRLAEDDEVVAVVGGLSGAQVRVAQPLLADASILFVSPVDSAPEHTRGADPAQPLRPYSTYFRTVVVGGDVVQTAADYAVGGLGAQKVAVVDGGGSDETARFAAEVRRRGADVVASAPAGTDGGGIARVIAASVSEQADVIYTADDAAVAAQIAKSLARTGLDAHLVGSSALHSQEFLSGAGTAAEGAVAVVAPTQRTSTAETPGELAARLADRGVEAGPLAATAYDAGTALAHALSRCLPPHDATIAAREECVTEMARVSFAGITGEIAFDAFGDLAGGRSQVYEVRNGAWVEIGGS
jgi:branched-chain amino acid transport system substrate-binding protein